MLMWVVFDVSFTDRYFENKKCAIQTKTIQAMLDTTFVPPIFFFLVYQLGSTAYVRFGLFNINTQVWYSNLAQLYTF